LGFGFANLKLKFFQSKEFQVSKGQNRLRERAALFAKYKE
jgi:hypothetical protein